MIFLSYHFFLFALMFFAAYYLITDPKLRMLILLGGSAVFHYHFAGPAGILPVIVLAIGTYLAGRSRNPKFCSIWIGACVISLVFYKYTQTLLVDTLTGIAPDYGAWLKTETSKISPLAPPLAISFFTFEFVHYLIEIKRGHRPIYSATKFAIFSIFWPSLVAGPIKRYRQFITTLNQSVRQVDTADIRAGIIHVSIGLVKKFAADSLTAVIEQSNNHWADLHFTERWILVGVIGLRILFDFSGYSDIAIGFARMMGIRLPENFNWPYLARNVGEFWRRWHISLSSWIRDYIYIPLGGSRKGKAHKAINGLLAMTLCGLWHGPSWNFALWGIYHGVGLIMSDVLTRRSAGNILTLQQILHTGTDIKTKRSYLFQWLVGWCGTMLFVSMGWLIFFYPLDKLAQIIPLLLWRH